jgi:hypothetical protein
MSLTQFAAKRAFGNDFAMAFRAEHNMFWLRLTSKHVCMLEKMCAKRLLCQLYAYCALLHLL